MTSEEIAGRILAEAEKRRAEAPGGGLKMLVALEGRCAAGKSTVAELLRERTGCGIVHMDHFYLRPEQRSRERYEEPGGNVDHERFVEEVLPGLKTGKEFSYRMFDCSVMELGESVSVPESPLTVVEGSYTCHPRLRELYDLRVFLDIEPEEQLRRIQSRNGEERTELFKSRWIPMEELYFTSCGVRECCDLILKAGGSGASGRYRNSPFGIT